VEDDPPKKLPSPDKRIERILRRAELVISTKITRWTKVEILIAIFGATIVTAVAVRIIWRIGT
jgi:hypothetical protein